MTEIRLFNTRTRKKEVFEPIDRDDVRIYVCGPTVYDRAHLGNARPVVVFDVLYRLMAHVYGPDHVTYVRNITDVEDKIIDRAAERGVEIDALTRETTRWFHEDMAALGVDYSGDPQFSEPRATEYIPQMVAMIETLIAGGHAYEAAGHVLFSVESYGRYGQLSGRSVKDMIAGARVEVAPYKKNPMDFVLWKPSTPDQPGWDSPWGRGRPGWHIECSAMSHALLGDSFDIHGGGIDLQFPHHENEIAQSCCAHPEGEFARVWMHNEMLQVDGRKMSKSLGNFFTVRDLLDRGVPGEVIRFVMLSTHYRKPMDWTEKKRQEAEMTLRKWYRFVAEEPSGDFPAGVINSLSDDLNTPGALTFLHSSFSSGKHGELRAGLELLGFDIKAIGEWAGAASPLSEEHRDLVAKMVYDRHRAKLNKDFERADSIRDALVEAGVLLQDQKDSPSRWDLSPDFDPAKLEALK